MSVKSECRMSSNEDVESGQCSDDEIQIIKTEKKTKKHKKKDKQRKCRKRKHSNSSGSARSHLEFFNPYSVNPGKFICKVESFEMMQDDQHEMNNFEITNNDIISETFNNLETAGINLSPNHSIESNTQSKDTVQEDSAKNTSKDYRLKELIKRRDCEYRIDISGIDTVTSDLYHYLLDLGLSQTVSGDLLRVYSKEEENVDDSKSNNDEDDGYEEEMINDIPIIDQGIHSEPYCGYSPERINDSGAPYKRAEHPHVAYASASLLHNECYSRTLIDPLSIPDVGPRDPRLNQTKMLLQVRSNPAAKLDEPMNEKALPTPDISPTTIKEWEETVTNVVETHLRLYLDHKDINKDEYKSILKRAVNKILQSGEKKLETDKIAKFLHSYVTMTLKSRSLNNI